MTDAVIQSIVYVALQDSLNPGGGAMILGVRKDREAAKRLADERGPSCIAGQAWEWALPHGCMAWQASDVRQCDHSGVHVQRIEPWEVM